MTNEKIENGTMKLNEQDLEKVVGGVMLDGRYVEIENGMYRTYINEKYVKSYPPAEGEHYSPNDIVRVDGRYSYWVILEAQILPNGSYKYKV